MGTDKYEEYLRETLIRSGWEPVPGALPGRVELARRDRDRGAVSDRIDFGTLRDAPPDVLAYHDGLLWRAVRALGVDADPPPGFDLR